MTGLFGETTLTLTNLRVHKEGEVKAKMLIAKRKLGAYVLDVDIHEVQGVLKPGKPTLPFGRNAVEVTLPVRLADGTGQAELRFQWDSKGAGRQHGLRRHGRDARRRPAAWSPRTTW